MSTLAVILIIAAGVLVVLAVVAFAIWAHQFTKVGPNEVLIISGRKRRAEIEPVNLRPHPWEFALYYDV